MPRLQFLTTEGAPEVPQATPTAFGSGAGARAFGEALEDVSGLGQQVYDAEMSMRTRRAIADSARELQDAAIEIQELPIEEQQKALGSKRAEIFARNRQRLGRTRYADLYDLRVGAIADESEMNLRQEQVRRRIDQSRADGLDAVDLLRRSAEHAPTREASAAYLLQAHETLVEMREKGVLTPTEAQRGIEELRAFGERLEALEQAQAEEDRIFGTISDPREREAAARKLSGKLRDDVLQRVQFRNDREFRDVQRADKDRYDRTIQGILDGEIDSLDEIQAAGLDGEDTVRALSVLQARTQERDPVTDLDYYAELNDLAQAREVAPFVTRKLDPVRLSRRDFKHFSDLQRVIARGEIPKVGKLKLEEVNRAIGLAANGQRWDRGERGKDAELFRQFDRAIRDGLEALGEDATREELDKLIDEQLTDVVVRRYPFGITDSVQRFRIGPETGVDVPDEALPGIRKELERVGRPFTQENVEALYRLALRKGTVKP